VHAHRSEERRLPGQGWFIPITSGAVHGERPAAGPPETHRYHFAAVLPGDDGTLRLRLWPRRFSDGKRFVPDMDATEPGKDYAEHRLRIETPATPLATSSAAPASSSTSVPIAPARAPAGGDSIAPRQSDRLRALVDGAHENEIASAISALLLGEHVAFQVPAGFGASRAVERVARLCQDSAGVIVHYISSRILFSDVNDWLDDIRRELARLAPLPGHWTEEKRDLRLFRELRDAARVLHQQGRRLIVCVDDVDRVRAEHQPWVAELLGVFGHLEDYSVTDDSLRSVRVLVAGGEWLHQHLVGRVKATPLSPFNKARRILLGPVQLPPAEPDPDVRRVLAEVGGHPELVLWAARHGGRTDGDPAAEDGLFAEQIARFRTEPLRGQIEQMLRGDEATWRDPDLAIRWSGWIKPDQSEQGWLGPVLERLARRVVTG
jgi:hypothetical protein